MLLTLKTNEEVLNWSKNHIGSLGFVPTMGALHAGHVSLFTKATKVCKTTIASVFVNPLQFNNVQDLAKYPKTIEADIKMLEKGSVSALFLPEADELYQNKTDLNYTLDIGLLANVYEGLMRPGHFNGVVTVLTVLFELIKPTDVFFGQKDLQQCLVVEKLILEKFNNIKLHILPTLREKHGLAMSSRNERLSKFDRETASIIYKELQFLKNTKNWDKNLPISLANLQNANFETEYLDLIDLPDMQKAEFFKPTKQAIVFAGWLGGVRLIDNIII